MKTDQERFDKEIEEFKENGFYTREDGSKSDEDLNKSKSLSKDPAAPKKPVNRYLMFQSFFMVDAR